MASVECIQDAVRMLVAYVEGSVRIEGNDLELAAEPSQAGHVSSLHDYLAQELLGRLGRG
jgi:hypothetical protein